SSVWLLSAANLRTISAFSYIRPERPTSTKLSANRLLTAFGEPRTDCLNSSSSIALMVKIVLHHGWLLLAIASYGLQRVETGPSPTRVGRPDCAESGRFSEPLSN